VCQGHFDEGEDWSNQYCYTFNGQVKFKWLKCRMPVAAGPKSALSTLPSAKPNRGVGADRLQLRYLESVGYMTAMEVQNMAWENDATAPPLLALNEAVRCVTGIESHKNSKVHKEKEAVVAAAAAVALAAASKNKNKTKKQTTMENQNNNKRKRGDSNEADKKPVATLDMKDRDVKHRTGFSSMSALLSYVAVVCNGDFEKMRAKGSFLTWLEEWFFTLSGCGDESTRHGVQHLSITVQVLGC
jgi:hypothetical protein